MAEKSPETNVVIPRNYGVVILGGDNPYFYDPARYIWGHIALLTQSQLYRWLGKWQEFKIDEKQKHEEGILNYVPKFPINGMENLLTMPTDDLERHIVDAISKKEGSKNLWMKGGRHAIKDAVFRGNSLSGIIKSNTRGWADTHMNNPFVTKEGTIEHRDLFCDKEEGDWESQKGFRVMCKHLAELETALYMQHAGMNNLKDKKFDYIEIDGNIRGLSPTLVFDFVSNHFLSNLEIDVLLAHYIKKQGFYSINRRLTDILDHYSAALNHTGDMGLARFGVMRQKAMDFDTKGYKRSKSGQETENRYMKRVRREIKSRGFRSVYGDRVMTYSLAFKGGPFETRAERYENGDEVIEIACFPDMAPLIISKRLYGNANFHSVPAPYNQNPFTNLNIKEDGRIVNKGKSEDTIDDYSRRRCRQVVFIPSSVPLAKNMAGFYRRMVREAQKQDAPKKVAAPAKF